MPPKRQANPGWNGSLDGAVSEARERYAAARPNSAALHKAARRHLPGGNTRSVLFYTPFPTAMREGQGCWLTDVDGHRYLDLCGEYTAGLFGHSEPRIIEALHAALDHGLNLSAVGEAEGRLAALLCERFPSLELVRFTNSGTEANMMALAAARAATRRDGVLGFRGGYHGGLLTFAFGQGALNPPLPVTLASYNDPDGVRTAIDGATTPIGAIIVEPMVGGGGCIPALQAFLETLRAEATRIGAILIFDEVMTSRHSRGGLQARTGVVPDMTTLGKYIGGGMSFGAFGGRLDIMDQFDAHRPGALVHSGTFNNNVMSMAAGEIAMTIFDGDTADALFDRGENLRERLNEVCSQAGASMRFTGAGSMLQPHFRAGLIEAPYVPAPEEELLRELFFLDMMSAGIYIARRGMAALSLPVGGKECDSYRRAVEEFCDIRRILLLT